MTDGAVKRVLSLREREQARLEQVEQTRLAARRDRVKAQAEAAGWSNVTVKHKAVFIAVSGDDPQGINRSGAFETDEEITAFLGHVIIPPRKRPGPVEAEIEEADGQPIPDPSSPMVSANLRLLMKPDETIAEAKARLTAELRDEFSELTNRQQMGAGSVKLPSGKTINERHAEISALFEELAKLGDMNA